MARKKPQKFDHIAFLFHGGGALGAYQVGVFKGLSEAGYAPDWVIGTSIGSINSAIIAGNAPEKRVKKLYSFWETIATKMPAVPNVLNNIFWERWQHFLSAQYTAFFGQPGFFLPRPISPWLGMQSTIDQLSYYDTSELRETLSKFIDFNRINDQAVRLSMGSVQVASGHLVYFDNTKINITVDHVMASGALPPGFPAICIDDHYYWDGGVHSNTQLGLLLCERDPSTYLCFMVHLFDSSGIRPTNMDELLKRQKDITYSSHHKQAIFVYKAIHNFRHAIRTLGNNLTKNKRKNPEIKKLLDLGQSGIIHLARFHCKARLSDLSTKDYEFSLPSIQNHMKDGCDDVNKALLNPPWNKPCPEDVGLVLYELSDTIVTDTILYDDSANYHIIT